MNAARIDLDFLLLTIATTLICVLGSRMNGASVIVDVTAMFPLSYPISCIGVATCQGDGRGFVRAARTFGTGDR